MQIGMPCPLYSWLGRFGQNVIKACQCQYEYAYRDRQGCQNWYSTKEKRLKGSLGSTLARHASYTDGRTDNDR